jgi:hypothetical protein
VIIRDHNTYWQNGGETDYTIVAIAMLALYDEFDTYWQNGGYKKSRT